MTYDYQAAFEAMQDGVLSRAYWDVYKSALKLAIKSEPTVPEFIMNAEEILALKRFYETCEDRQGYDVHERMMIRLAHIGAVSCLDIKTRDYGISEFGLWVLGKHLSPTQPAPKQAGA